MTEKNGILTFECDKDSNGNEILNSTQRNNELVFPDPKKYPKSQYTTKWSNECNVTSYAMFLEYSGAKFPSGPYKQPEDNLGYFILTDKRIIDHYKSKQPVLYNAWIKALKGIATKEDLKSAYPPNELHDYLCTGANLWLGYDAAKFSTNVNFKKALWDNMVDDNLPLVISTTFGGFGHIVCVSGVQYKKEDYLALRAAKDLNANNFNEMLNTTDPVAIIVDDPWGKYNPKTNKYDAPNGGNDIIVPWDVVVARVKPANSTLTKWCHQINKRGMAIV